MDNPRARAYNQLKIIAIFALCVEFSVTYTGDKRGVHRGSVVSEGHNDLYRSCVCMHVTGNVLNSAFYGEKIPWKCIKYVLRLGVPKQCLIHTMGVARLAKDKVIHYFTIFCFFPQLYIIWMLRNVMRANEKKAIRISTTTDDLYYFAHHLSARPSKRKVIQGPLPLEL